MPKEQPVVLLIIPNLGPGGAQHVFRQHYDYLSRHFVVHGCVFNWSGTQKEQWPASIKSLDVPGGINTLQKVFYFLQRISRLRKIKKLLGVNVSISHLEGADYINVLSDVGEKRILWIHGTKKFDAAIQGWIGYLRKSWLMPWLYRRANRIVTVSQAIAEEIALSYPALHPNLCTVYNGIDWPRIQSLMQVGIQSEYDVLCGKYVVIITHSRLAIQKNLSGLLSLIRTMHDHAEIKWVIIGDGELRNSLVKDCKKMGIEYWAEWEKENWSEMKQLYFLGHQENPFPFLMRASLYIMPSAWEGFPLALCEALACSLPVIATDCYTGPREILAPGEQIIPKASEPEYAQYGLLMPQITSKTLKVWTHEIIELANNKEKQSEYRDLAALRANTLSLESSLEQLHSVINSVLHG